jgi:hypothetical protein
MSDADIWWLLAGTLVLASVLVGGLLWLQHKIDQPEPLDGVGEMLPEDEGDNQP